MRYAPERKRIVAGGFNITLNFTIPTITVAHLFFRKTNACVARAYPRNVRNVYAGRVHRNRKASV